MATIFLSYSSDQGEAATRIELALKEEGHNVFRDRSSLPAGESFDARIRNAVEECDLFVLLIEDPTREGEALRVANEMRINGETRPSGWEFGSLKRKLWSIYHFDVVTDDGLEPLLATLPSAEHLALFRWLFPEDDLPEAHGAPSLLSYLFVLGQLQEHGGERAGALVSYRRLLREAANKNYNSSRAIKMVNDVNAAIKRLSS
jgi:TIR domain